METSKKLDSLISQLKELDQDLSNVIALGCDVKQLEMHLKKFLK